MALSLKILLVGASQQKTMRFMQDMSVSEAIKEIREKTNVGGPDHGLFQPGEAERPARWLKENRTLALYQLENNVSEFIPQIWSREMYKVSDIFVYAEGYNSYST